MFLNLCTTGRVMSRTRGGGGRHLCAARGGGWCDGGGVGGECEGARGVAVVVAVCLSLSLAGSCSSFVDCCRPPPLVLLPSVVCLSSVLVSVWQLACKTAYLH
jgi:hypothetical protein